MKHLRMALEGETPPVVETVQLTVAVESLFDSIKDLLGHNKKAPSPDHDDKGKETDHWKYRQHKWVVTYKEAILKTYGNLSWVQKNLRDHPIDDANLAAHLSLSGKPVELPEQTLLDAEKIVLAWQAKHLRAYEAYDKKLKEAEDELQRRYDRGIRGRALAEQGIEIAKSIPRPFSDTDSSPEIHGSVSTSKSRAGETKPKVPAKTQLPALKAEDVVAAAHTLVRMVEDPKLGWDTRMAGLSCDYGFWVSEENSYDTEGGGDELWDLYYHQSGPEEQSNLIAAPLWGLKDLIGSVGRWLVKATAKA